MKKLKIFFTAAELTPLAKAGGLGDVAGSLPKAMYKLGHKFSFFLPFHEQIDKKQLKNFKHVKNISVLFNGKNEKAEVYRCDFPNTNQPLYLFKSNKYISRGGIYDNNKIQNPFTGKQAAQQDGIPIKYFFFSKCVRKFVEEENLEFDVYHYNDWHTVPVMLHFINDSEKPQHKNLLTIHNLGARGSVPAKLYSLLGLPKKYTGPLEKKSRIITLKLGIKFADLINTVSPTYAKEILTPEYGAGLQSDLKKRKKDLYGIINGLDLDLFNPQKDQYLKYNFNLKTISKKKKDKAFLQKKSGLKVSEDIPVFGLVTRLARQKGIDLILAVLDDLAKLDAQYIFTGTGIPPYENGFKKAMKKYPDKFYFLNDFDIPFGQWIYGGADVFFMPSNFEPCGLGQMIAMEYGTIPVVRATGGLADTVKEGQTGFTFKDKDPEQFLRATKRAVKAYQDQTKWMRLMENGMTADHSWTNSAREYQKLYYKLEKL
ncbi:glycogen synthase [Patescibacteria group bacterium]|nr:glycogen synthase [Patescibacteria group bacterium]MBU1673685.1 glycogen synthase [Patescibacteria group bacterium]MBU1963495.1 glycogen synthase [Patescibacteria group bacterium]